MVTLDFGQWEAEKVAGTLADLGFKGVEWTLAHFDIARMSDKQLKSVVDSTHKYGLEVSELCIQQDLVHFDAEFRKKKIELTKNIMIKAAQCGIEIVNLITGPASFFNEGAPSLHKEIQEGQAWEMVFAAFDEFVPLAEKHNVRIAMEAVFSMVCRDYYSLKELLDHYDSEYLGVNMDPSHLALYDNDIPWVVKQLGKKNIHTHIKDVAGKPGAFIGDGFVFPLLGEGKINWNEFFAALDDTGYEGYLSLEFESFGYYEQILDCDPVKAAAISKEQLDKLLSNYERYKASK